MTTTRRSLIAVAAVSLAIAGCGDDVDRPERSPEGRGSSSFLQRGNDILCESRHDFAGSVVSQILSGDPSPDEARRRFLPAYRAIRDGLAPLQPPPADASAFAAIVDDLGAAIDRADRNPSLLLGDDDPFAEVERQMAQIGLDGCA